MMLARVAPEFAITEPEALSLAKAWVEWRSHYASIVDPKTEALFSLIVVVAMIEGPRVAAMSARMKAEATAKRLQAQANRAQANPNVVPINAG